MESVPFVKYHGAGNDFIMIDDRAGFWGNRLHESWIAMACHRRFGIGADGMILLQQGSEGADFFMKYYNSDGRTSSFCGNGGRCIVAFAFSIGVHRGTCTFLGTDGWHHGEMLNNGLVRISMNDVHDIISLDEKTFTLNTGSPHYVTFVDLLSQMDVVATGRSIRQSAPFAAEGINVNFAEKIGPDEIMIRTYERGVEDETFACGTGVVAAAIASAHHYGDRISSWKVHAKGGGLKVDFDPANAHVYTGIRLTGPAVEVFSGEIPLV